MLLNGQPSRVNELTDYLRRVSGGAAEMQAWEQVFGTARTDGELRQYLRRPTFMTVVIDFPEKVAAVPMTETALSAADAAGFLASLQLRNLGPEAAAKILEPALKQEPANATANVAMARIDLARHDPAGAAKRVLASAPERRLVRRVRCGRHAGRGGRRGPQHGRPRRNRACEGVAAA